MQYRAEISQLYTIQFILWQTYKYDFTLMRIFYNIQLAESLLALNIIYWTVYNYNHTFTT